jgi:hypothetical protein
MREVVIYTTLVVALLASVAAVALGVHWARNPRLSMGESPLEAKAWGGFFALVGMFATGVSICGLVNAHTY